MTGLRLAAERRPAGRPLSYGRLEREFREDVLAGLSKLQKAIPPRWFYDEVGSLLFEAITKLPEYRVTRLERKILEKNSAAIAAGVGRGRALVELGSGSSAKTPLVLDAVRPSLYVPIDISGDFLRSSAAQLQRFYPGLRIEPVEGDFMAGLELPPDAHDRARLIYFPGSTIGNLSHAEAVDLLRSLEAGAPPDTLLLIGIDAIAPEGDMVAAYDDAAGVTAAFNLNLLHRINRELAGTIPVSRFEHRARWNGRESRIEMHLQAVGDLEFRVAGRLFSMRDGETIHTENSHKYDAGSARLLLSCGHWEVIDHWSDAEERFSVFLARA